MSDQLFIEIDRKTIMEMFSSSFQESVEKKIFEKQKEINSAIDRLLDKGLFDRTANIDSQLDWVIETAVRQGLEKAIEEVGLSQLITDKTKEILSDEKVLAELAKKKIEKSLGL